MGVEMTVSTSFKAMLSYIDSPEYISSLNLAKRAHILLDTFVHNFRIHLLVSWLFRASDVVKVIDVTARKSRARSRRNVSDPLFASNEGLTTSDNLILASEENQNMSELSLTSINVVNF